MKLSTIIILFVFIISLIMAVINAALSKVKNPIHISAIGFLFKRREKIVSQRVRLNAVFMLSVYAFALSIIWCSETLAQSCANYAPVTRATGITYNSIAGLSPSYFTWRNTTLNQNDDNRSYPVPIGFDFWYLGVRYTQITGSLNGTLDFSTSTSDGNNGGTGPYGPNYNNLFSTANQTMLALAPLYADLWTANAGTTPIATSLVYQVSGSAPNRVLTVEWINFDEWNSPVNVPAASVNMQAKIYETIGVIEFIYGTMTAGASGGGSYPLRYTCGINNTWSVGAPNATQLLTQQVANTITFNNTPQNALTTLPTSNSKLTFTPPVPTAAPTGLTFTAITQSGMTLNWTDNATNEVGYAVYNSMDNVNFNFVVQTTASATSTAVTSLSSGTTYYWKVYAVTDGALSSQLTGSEATLPAGTITSIANGNWSATGTWDCGCIPTAGDNVIIANGTAVTLDVDGSCNSLIVGQGVSGQLIIGNDAIARTLTVGNDVIVNSGGTIITGTTDATHIMNVGGNLTNNGTLNLAPTATRVCNVTFNKNGNQTISGAGVITNFNCITLNMGTSNFNVLDVASNNFSAASNFLTLTNGTLKLSAAANITPYTGNVTIPFSSGIWLNNAGAVISTTGGTITLYGLLRATAGTMNIGSATDNNLTSYGGTITIDGGTVNIAGRLDRAGPTILTYFTMSSGTLTVATVGSTTVGAAPFRIDEVGSTFNMSGGTIIIRRPGAGNLGYVNTGGTVGIVSGGTLQIGDASTPAAQTIQINSSIAVPNLVISNGVAVTAQLVTNSLFVTNDVSITSGTLNANGLNITLGGNWTNNGGTFTPGTGTVTLNGTANQTLTGATIFYNLTVNNITGITIASNQTVNWILTLTNGIITTNSNSIILPSSGSITRSQGYVNGNLQKYVGTGAIAPIFEIGSGSYSPVVLTFSSVTTPGNLTASVTAAEHPDISASALDNTKSVNRYWTLINNGIAFTTYDATFTFVSGDVDTGTTTNNFFVGKYATSSWSLPTVGTRTSTTTQITGVSSFGDFAIGEKKTYSITASAGTGGTISPSGTVTVTHGDDQSFSIAANAHYHISDVLVDTSSQGAISAYTFTNVTAAHIIAASFALDTYTLTVNTTDGTVAKNPDQPIYNHGLSVELTATPAVGYHFVDWTGDATGSVNPVTITMDSNKNITANFAINTYTINATAGANGGISPSGNITVNHDGNQTFTITPDVGYNVADLFVDGIHQDSVASYTFYNVTANHTINATFSINLYTINATASAGGTIIPNGTVAVPHGGSQQFIISPDVGYHFIDLFVDGIHSDSMISYTFENAVVNHTIDASFAINTYTLNITATNGTVAKNPDQPTYDHGTNVELTATPSTGYHFVDWAGDTTSSITPVTVTMDGNKTVTANFAINTYTLTVNATNGTVAKNPDQPTYDYETTIELTATPSMGYHFIDWTGDAAGSVNPITVMMDGNKSITANFGLNSYTITATAGLNGSINPSGSIVLNHGADQLFSMLANLGYHIADVLVDGISVGAVTSYDFNDVSSNHTIDVSFEINLTPPTRLIIATAGSHGTIDPAGVIVVNTGDDQAFTITPDEGYHVASLMVDSIHQDSTTSYTFYDVVDNHSINVAFSIDVYAIIASASAGGTIVPADTVAVPYGASQSFAVIPNPGFHLIDLFVDGIHQDSIVSYTFDDVKTNHTIHADFGINTYTISTSVGIGGTIDPSGAVSVDFGASRTFVIISDAGYQLDGLFVDGIHTDSTTSYTFINVTDDHTINATFRRSQFTITATAGSGGIISPSGGVTVLRGGTQRFTFTHDAGYHLDELQVDGLHQDSATGYTFRDVTDDHTINVSFAIDTYIIASTAGSNGTIDPEGNINISYGSNRTFTFFPEPGYHVDSLFVDFVRVDSTQSYTFYNVNSNHAIHVTFGINKFTITAGSSAGGTIDPSGIIVVDFGEDKEFSFEPNTGYSFDSLFVDGIPVDSAARYTFYNITANHTIYAKFAMKRLMITATASAGGTIAPLGVVSVNFGENKIFIVTPNTGYNIDSIFVDGEHVDSTISYTFYSVEENHSIYAKFAIKKFAITATADTGGSIMPNGIINVNYGASQRFTVAPDVGYDFAELTVDGAHVDSTLSYTFINVTTVHSVHATFVIQKFTITASAGTGGTITPSGSVQVNYGDSILFTMHPQTGYIVDSIFVDDIYVDNDTVYNIENVIANHTIHVTFTFEDDVKNKLSQIPKEFALHQNYPNPFNPSTMIQFDLPQRSVVTLKVYNLIGSDLLTLIDNRAMEAGIKIVEINSQNLASGLYFYRIVAEGADGQNFTSVRRMIILK
jgi:uncharacterized repeat protein (TIGR02543 family)